MPYCLLLWHSVPAQSQGRVKINDKIHNKMVKDYLIPIAIVVAGLIVYNMLIKKLLPDTFDSTAQ